MPTSNISDTVDNALPLTPKVVQAHQGVNLRLRVWAISYDLNKLKKLTLKRRVDDHRINLTKYSGEKG